MRKLFLFSIVVVLLMTAYCMCLIAKAEAPLITLDVLRKKTEWTPSSIKTMIWFVSREYAFKDPDTLIWLADRESDIGENKNCGDDGKSCYLFQIQKPTWDGWIKEFGLEDAGFEWSNYVDQTIITIIAFQHHYQCDWGPMWDIMKCK